LLVHNPGPSQTVTLIPLSSPFGMPQADDTVFVTGSDGFLLMSDTPGDTVYKINKARWVTGAPYTAAVGAPDANGNSVGFVGVLDLNFGDIRPVVMGFQSPHGMAFVNLRGDDGGGAGSSCPAQ